MEQGWVRRIIDIKQRELQSSKHPRAFVGITADRQQQPVCEWLQVVGIARHVQLAQKRRGGGDGQIHHKQRIGELEGHKVGAVLNNPGGIELLIGRDASQATDHSQALTLRL